jgi:putative ABC transport system ATP-binding protein
MSYIEFKDVDKKYQMGEVEILALNDASFEIEKGELVCILGPSGAGKTTCLNILGGMDSATLGKITVDEVRIDKLNEKELIKYRRNDIGFVFQFYNLIQNLTALENVELAVQLCKDHLDPKTILTKVGLKDRLYNFPSQLSGGEQQRVAIARAIAKNPKLLLCDEPTGALDYKTGKQILKLLEKVCREDDMTVIIITHNSVISEIADRVIRFNSGKVQSVTMNKNPKSVDDIEW